MNGLLRWLIAMGAAGCALAAANEPGSVAVPAVAAPGAPAVPQNPRLGMTLSNYFAGNPMYARARDAGASYDRIDFQMAAMNPSPGVWDWAAYDTLVGDETANGLQVLAVLTSPPVWASDLRYSYESWPAPAGLQLPWDDPGNYWAQFVYRAVRRYTPTIRMWQVWNEPDIRVYWKMPDMPASLFARLLQVSYQAIKAADPSATVVLGGFLYRHDQWPSPITVWNAIRDLPGSAANHNYFDVASFHLYDGGTCDSFDVIEDFKLNMTRPDRGGLLDHPLWITETGIRHWDGYAGSPPAGSRYALPDEAASFVIQNYAYALYKNIPRYFYFRTTDDGSPEQWGLIRPDGSLRPAYTAYQVAARYLPAAYSFSTRVWTNDGSVSRISYWGTPLGRVSVVWNITNTSQTYVFSTILPTATLVLQNMTATTLAATGKQITFTLAPAPNFTWHNPPDYCLVASPPLILIESDVVPPTSTLSATTDPLSPLNVTLTWAGQDDLSGVWFYDLQVRRAQLRWTQLLTRTGATRYLFTAEPGQAYDFRARAHDRAGNPQDWSTAPVVPVEAIDPPDRSPRAYLPLLQSSE